MTFTLNDILTGVENAIQMQKQADEYAESDDKKATPEKDEKKDESKAKKDVDKAKEEVDNAAKEVSNAEKKNGEEEEQCKEARLQGAALAQEIMSKVAAQLNPQTTKEPEMNKQAAAAGQALAEALLTKLANAGDVSTENGIAPNSVPNKNIVDSAQIVATDNAKVQPLPTSQDGGVRAEGDVNQILEGIVADAIAQGGVGYDQVAANTAMPSQAQGRAEMEATPHQVPDESVDETEKAAAVSALVQNGYDFATAVDLVKAAEEEMKAEQEQQIKQAAIGALLDRGVEFDKAVAMVKQASAKMAMPVKGKIAKPATASAETMQREKKAAFDALTANGVDFETAVKLVADKSKQIYGV